MIACRNYAKYAEIGRKIRALPLERAAVSHEWEELVLKLCASEDAALHTIGIKELRELEQGSTIVN